LLIKRLPASPLKITGNQFDFGEVVAMPDKLKTVARLK